jgi:hypothetical protein
MLSWRRRSAQRAALALLCLIGIAGNAFVLGPALTLVPRGVTDFMDLYAGGKLAFSRELYNPVQLMNVEATTEGSFSPTRLFMRLPVFAITYWPLAQLPYRTASAIWEILCIAALAGFAILWPSDRGWAAALACCWSLPAFMTVAEGQDIGFLLLWVALAVRLLGKNRPSAAGAVFSLCAAKFHLFLLLPAWIVANKAWRFASGVIAGGAILIFLSFIANGRDWPLRYYGLLSNPTNNPYASVMPNIHGMVIGWPHHKIVEAAGIALVLTLVWFASRRRNAECGLATVLAGGILATPHAYMADCALLIPAVLIVLANTSRSWTRTCGVFLLTPFPYVLLMVGVAFELQLLLLVLLLAIVWENGMGNAVRIRDTGLAKAGAACQIDAAIEPTRA